MQNKFWGGVLPLKPDPDFLVCTVLMYTPAILMWFLLNQTQKNILFCFFNNDEVYKNISKVLFTLVLCVVI